MKSKLILKRIAAYLIDIILLFVVLSVLALLVERWLKITPQTPIEVWIAAIMSFSIPTWIYFILSDQSATGATIGKKIMRLHAVTRAGARIGLARAVARTAIKLFPWELAHIFGFALADVVGPGLRAAGIITANVLVVAYLAVCLVTGGK